MNAPTKTELHFIRLIVHMNIFIHDIEEQMRILSRNPIRPKIEICTLRNVIRSVEKDLALLRKWLKETDVKMYRVEFVYDWIHWKYKCRGILHEEKVYFVERDWPLDRIKMKYLTPPS